MKENFEIFDFELTDEEMEEIHDIDKNQRFFTMTLEEQEAHLSQFVPADLLYDYFVFLIYTDGYSNHYECVWGTVLAVNSGIYRRKT